MYWVHHQRTEITNCLSRTLLLLLSLSEFQFLPSYPLGSNSEPNNWLSKLLDSSRIFSFGITCAQPGACPLSLMSLQSNLRGFTPWWSRLLTRWAPWRVKSLRRWSFASLGSTRINISCCSSNSMCASRILLYHNSYDDTYFVTRFITGLKEDIRSVNSDWSSSTKRCGYCQCVGTTTISGIEHI